MRKADDIQRKKIVEFYLQCENYSETARNFGLSTPTVKKIVEACDIITLLREKKAENTAQIVSMMDDKTGKVLQIIDRYLTEALNETKIEKTNLKDLFTAYGIIIDKQFKAEEIKLNRERLKLEREKLEHTKKNGIQDDDVIEVVVKRKELSA